ncbi:MAG: hypothetical protein HY560_06955 [Gemmatimonadetes bacterium]|nr:hypothetical protein [Gemmatimonadota bacterium]
MATISVPTVPVGAAVVRRVLRVSLAMLAAVLIGAFHVATIREGHEWGDDWSMYVAHARNLARGTPYAETGYTYNPHDPAVGPRVYPPGFPVLLAPVVKGYGVNLRAMKVLLAAFFVASLLLIPPMIRGALPSPLAPALVLVVGLNPFFWDFKDQIMSDVPFLFLALLSLLAFRRAVAADEFGATYRRRITLAASAGLAAYAAYLTRVPGVVLLATFVAHDLVRHRTIRATSAVATAVFALFATAQYVLGFRDGSYLDQGTPSLGVVLEHARDYLRSLSALWDNGYSDWVRKVAFLGVAALAITGYRRAISPRPGVLELFPLLYAAVILGWNSFQDTRFLIPVIPFFMFYALLGARAIDENIGRRWKQRHLAFAAVVGISLLSYVARYSTLEFGPIGSGVERPESAELFAFVRQETGPEDVVLFSKPRALALYTGRRASVPHYPSDPCALWAYIREIGATYVITGPTGSHIQSLRLAAFVERFRDGFQEVMRNRDFAVLRVARNPC